jgi:hypothetical protein
MTRKRIPSAVRSRALCWRVGTFLVALAVVVSAGLAAGAASAVVVGAAPTVVPITLTARGYEQGRIAKADLAWSAPSGTTIYVYRDGTRIATVQSTACTDSIDQKGSGSYTYNVCAAALSSGSKQVTVSF